jgi:hypothetical protein
MNNQIEIYQTSTGTEEKYVPGDLYTQRKKKPNLKVLTKDEAKRYIGCQVPYESPMSPRIVLH